MEKNLKNQNQSLTLHRRIVASFRFNPYRDFLAGIELSDLIERDAWDSLPKEDVVSVIGPSNPSENPNGYVIVADSALNHYSGRIDMIVSDLDGPIEKIIEQEDSVKVIHAHGDNIKKLRTVVPRIRGTVLGTTQSIPVRRVRNIGGFTDGDRSVIMATLLGAKRIFIHGFDYSNPVDEPRDMKVRKMQFAKGIIDNVKSAEVVYVRR
ncbi:MAG: 6-hydroxymethylpterin diphosphokinase MptE-like protein [Thermoplasmata archaeon]